MSQEEDRKNRLMQERSRVQPENKLQKLMVNLAKEAGVSNAGSLVSFFELTDIFFIIALTTSLLKDIFDPIGGIFIIFGFMASIVTWAAMLVCGAGTAHRSKPKKITQLIFNKWGIFSAGTIFETLLVGLNFLPLQTITTLIVFILILKERKIAYQEQKIQEAAAIYA